MVDWTRLDPYCASLQVRAGSCLLNFVRLANDMKMITKRPIPSKPRKSKRHVPHTLLAAALATASLAGLVSCAAGPGSAAGTADHADLVAEGRQFASLRCATCHAMDKEDFGSNPNAPPMKRLLPRLEFKMLKRESSQEIDMVHATMPPLHLSLSDRDTLVAYLKSIAE